MEDDWYGLLGVPSTATVKEINKAYRQAALKCHPDKVGSEDTVAAALFLRLKEAVEHLSDTQKRQEYDNLYKAKMAQKARTDQLDSARRKRKEDLEAKESAAKRSRMDADERAINLEKIDRLRKENIQKLDEAMGVPVPSASKAAKDEKQSFVNPNIPMTEKKEGILVVKPRKGYSPTEDEVRSIFFKYGEFTLVSTKKSFLMAFPDESILIRILRDSTNPILSKFKIMAQEEKIPDIDQPLPKPESVIHENITSDFEMEILRHMRQRDRRKQMAKMANEAS